MSTATVAIKERPIIFSGAMVRALIDDRKFQTRRVIKPQPPSNVGRVTLRGMSRLLTWHYGEAAELTHHRCPYEVGTRLWVRETLKPKTESAANGEPRGVWAYYAADDTPCPDHHVITKSVPSIFMPRALSRITLEITDVRVERVQDISEDDAIAEGYYGDGLTDAGRRLRPPRQQYQTLWDSINAKRGYSWAANPFVWVIAFRRL